MFGRFCSVFFLHTIPTLTATKLSARLWIKEAKLKNMLLPSKAASLKCKFIQVTRVMSFFEELQFKKTLNDLRKKASRALIDLN